jgi:hypothetical protein
MEKGFFSVPKTFQRDCKSHPPSSARVGFDCFPTTGSGSGRDLKLIAEINKVVHLTYIYLQGVHRDKFIFLRNTSLIGTGDV